MRIKLILSLVVVLTLMPLLGASAVELKPIGITVDGKKQDAQGILWDGGFTFVPARTVLESVCAQFSYDAATKTLSATSPVAFSITADQENGKPILMDIPPILIKNMFMIPPHTVTQLFKEDSLPRHAAYTCEPAP